MAHDAAAVLKQVKNLEDFRVLMALLEQLDYENLITTNQAEIARELDMQRQNVQRSIKRLMALGVLLEGLKIGISRSYRLNPEFGWRGERQEPHRHAGSGAQKANGEGRDQGRDRGRPASPAASPRARPGHAGHVRRLRPPEQHQGSDVYSLHIAAQCTFETAKCARSKQRSAHVRNSEVRTFETAKCALTTCYASPCSDPSACGRRALVVSPKPREARADQERLRRPSGGVRHVAGGWGKAPQPPARAWGSFLGVKAKLLRGRCASLDPHPLRQCPPPPCAGLWRVFRVKGGSRGWWPRSPVGRGHGPLTRPERPKPAGRVSGALFPAPCPSARGPRQAAGGACKACGAGGTPCRGSKGRAAPWA